MLVLLKNDQLRAELGKNARLRVMIEFNTQTKLLELEAVFENLYKS
jgi:hypothetical protein